MNPLKVQIDNTLHFIGLLCEVFMRDFEKNTNKQKENGNKLDLRADIDHYIPESTIFPQFLHDK